MIKGLLRVVSMGLVLLLMSSVNLLPSKAADADFSGPSQGPVNTESAPFTITVDRSFNGNFHVDISGGGLDERKVLSFPKNATSTTFTITPTATGTVTLIANPASGPKSDKTLLYNVIGVI
ncbi:MAG: hypothetical protein EBW79_06530, partial [Actinobacteria bacterium]|nr:hypothetical protein [Actinomycetota bacterium]